MADDMGSDQLLAPSDPPPAGGGFSVIRVLRRSFSIFFSNQRGFWRLVIVPWLLICLLGGPSGLSLGQIIQGGTLDIFKWLAVASVRLLFWSAILAPMLVAWHQLVLRSAPLPATWISPIKQDRTTFRFILGLFAFFIVIGLSPRLTAYLSVGSVLASGNTSLTLAGFILATTMAGIEIILLLALFKLSLIFPELATGQYSSFRMTWQRSAPAPFKFFFLLLALYLIDLAISMGVRAPLDTWTWTAERTGTMTVPEITLLYTWVIVPIFKLIGLASAVVAAIALSLSFQELKNLQRANPATSDAY